MSDIAAAAFDTRTGLERPASILPASVRGLTLDLDGARILDGVDLDLGRRGCTVIMGPNGAGKSLLLKALHGLVAPSCGVVDWNGEVHHRAADRQAMVFQNPVLLRRSVAANIDFVLKARGRPTEARDALLARVGLLDKAKQAARRLSGGEAQRLALARALATEPDLLFLDEPTASLDPGSVLAIEDIVAGACRSGTRVVLVTHDIGQARRMADDVVFLHRGKVLEHKSAADFFEAPRSAEAAAFLESRIVL